MFLFLSLWMKNEQLHQTQVLSVIFQILSVLVLQILALSLTGNGNVNCVVGHKIAD